ncbi:hypothetical protein LOK49_LG09G02013 [Camellia lanceoleosa]|uniref:Uncharacterized protein n=1 Tax=Camellia lanceoleosa TaxID=1840588 RepID=A0ACC0GEN6_9ERIC|nr:hypothetical protein LOK49_LG09G02013 [Camellia lanceoleosa]
MFKVDHTRMVEPFGVFILDCWFAKNKLSVELERKQCHSNAPKGKPTGRVDPKFGTSFKVLY